MLCVRTIVGWILQKFKTQSKPLRRIKSRVCVVEPLEFRTCFAASDFDTSFGIGGFVNFHWGTGDGSSNGSLTSRDFMAKNLIQSDGKSVIVGSSFNGQRFDSPGSNYDVTASRLNRDGSIDPTFGENGKFTLHGVSNEFAYSAVLQADGKILIGGSVSSRDVLILRLTANGNLDSTFGTNGIARMDLFRDGNDNLEEDITSIAVRSDGKILVAGSAIVQDSSVPGGRRARLFLAQFNGDGSRDIDFGVFGIALSAPSIVVHGGAAIHGETALAIQQDGRIVIASTNRTNPFPDFAIQRFMPSGATDLSFGNFGVSGVDFRGTADAVTCLLIQTDGKILVGGNSHTGLPALQGGAVDCAIARLNSDGSLDSSFGIGGRVVQRVAGNNNGLDNGIMSIALQQDGKIVSTGAYGTGSTQPIVFRLESNGAIDNTFGKLLINGNGNGKSVVIREDGRILVAGDDPPASLVFSLVGDATSFPPTISGISNALPLLYRENATPILVANAATVSDADSTNFDRGKLYVDIASNLDSSDRILVKNIGINANQISVHETSIFYHAKIGNRTEAIEVGSFSGGNERKPLIVTFNANATKREVQAVVRAISFENSSQNPSVLLRKISFVLSDGDGGTSNSVNRTVGLSSINDNPVVIASFSTTEYVENGNPVILDDSILISDIDSPDLNQGKLTIRITSGFQATDRIGIKSSGMISVNSETKEVLFGSDVIGVYVGTRTLTITLNALATPERVQELARHIVFYNVSDALNSNDRTISFSLTDGDGGRSSIGAINTIHVIPANDDPLIGGISRTVPMRYLKNASPTLIASRGTVTDADLLNFGGGTLSVSLTANGSIDDRLSIKSIGTGLNQVSTNGSTILFNSLIVGTFEGGFGSGSPLVVLFTSQANKAAVQATLRAITFSIDSINPSLLQREVSFSLLDGDGGTSNTALSLIDVRTR